MWLSKQSTKALNRENPKISEISQSNSDNISANDDFEHKNVKIILPYGIFYKAPKSEKCLIFPIDNNYMCLGTIMKNANLSEGDLYLSTKTGTGILLKANGDIEINGNVKINGVVQ